MQLLCFIARVQPHQCSMYECDRVSCWKAAAYMTLISQDGVGHKAEPLFLWGEEKRAMGTVNDIITMQFH